ncbi:CAP domain-containing protein [Asticcacaulis sp. AC402]|uniref:CAP domain-containing protein n=1 Tax=Asticcacaulis sp. AC402 TaxID=1282361 RepID=UPI0003C3AEEB|nr:CAP domain-containing protein [Asticcacaulis sp. AC402]ESQ75021.1 hypothetical protein ABAC402_11495 [Asticcacaulis sp. AC402]
MKWLILAFVANLVIAGAGHGRDAETDKVVALINAEREIAGCPALVVNRQLEAAAQRHSESMAGQDFFGHVDPDGLKVAQRAEAAGYRWMMVGENISAGYVTADATVAGWMNSPGHRSNILTCGFTETGVGHVYIPDDVGKVKYGHYWTQVFGRPMAEDRFGRPMAEER